MKDKKATLPPEAVEFFKRQGSIGGRAAADRMTPEQRSERSRKAAAAMTAQQRSERARKAVQAREAKRQATSAPPSNEKIDVKNRELAESGTRSH